MTARYLELNLMYSTKIKANITIKISVRRHTDVLIEHVIQALCFDPVNKLLIK